MLPQVATGCSIRRPMPDFAFEGLGLAVRTSPDLPKCVVFVGVETNGRFTPVGTGFLLAIRHRDYAFYFLATADHVVEMIAGDAIWVRMNRKAGDCSSIKIEKKQKFGPTDLAQDIAMFSLDYDPSVFDQRMVLLNRENYHLGLEKVWDPQVGDEVSTVGLYTSHYGQMKNLPVVRIGHIALMPGEPVLTHRGYAVAYLIEGKSIAGLSGSPVFANIPTTRVSTTGKLEYATEPKPVPIGMVTGYHLVKSSQDQISVPTIQGDPVEEEDDPSADERNTGFAVVIPWDSFLTVSEDEQLIKALDETIKAELENSSYRPAGLSPSKLDDAPPASDANPTHQEDFRRLVSLAARKPAQED